MRGLGDHSYGPCLRNLEDKRDGMTNCFDVEAKERWLHEIHNLQFIRVKEAPLFPEARVGP